MAIDSVFDYSRQEALVEGCKQLQGKVEALELSRIKPSTSLKEIFSVSKTTLTDLVE